MKVTSEKHMTLKPELERLKVTSEKLNALKQLKMKAEKSLMKPVVRSCQSLA